jgi:hypothetical protein
LVKTMRSRILILLASVSILGASSAFAAGRIGVLGAANQHITGLGEGAEKRDLKLGDDIYFKDTISADKTGNAQLLFVDKSALTVGPNSSVTIDEFVYNPATSSGNMVVNSTKGTFRFIGGALSKKDAVQIKTPVGTIGIRGGIAIVKIDPVSGATNATFVYGDKMTFQNMAGQMQAVTDKGLGIKVDTPTSIPTTFQVPVAQMASQVQELAGKPGTSAGAVKVPTEGDVGKGLITGKGNPTDANNPTGGDKGKGGGANADPKNKDGKTQDGAANQGNTGTNANKGPGAAGGHATADGGYVDGNGKYFTPAEVAANKAANPDNTANPTGGPRNPGQLTADGGYIDTNGKPHTAAELAEFRRNEGAMGGSYNGATVNGGPVNSGPIGTNGPNPYGPNPYGPPIVNPNPAPMPIQPYIQSYQYVPPPSTTIDAVANDVYNTVYNRVMAYNGNSPSYITQANGEAEAARTIFKNQIINGITIEVARTAGFAATQYMVNNTGTTNYTSVLQDAQNTALGVNTNGKTKFSMDNTALPVGNVTSPNISPEAFDNRANLNAVMTANKVANCSSCSYVNWDVWAQVIPNGATSTATAQAKLVPYVYGTMTPPASIPGSVGVPINATYTGATSLNINNAGGISNQQGTFSANISLRGANTANLTGFSFGIPGQGATLTYGGAPVAIGGSSAFTGLAVSGNGFTGNVNGALFGPAAENIGGNMNFSNGGAITGAGVYVGGR